MLFPWCVGDVLKMFPHALMMLSVCFVLFSWCVGAAPVMFWWCCTDVSIALSLCCIMLRRIATFLGQCPYTSWLTDISISFSLCFMMLRRFATTPGSMPVHFLFETNARTPSHTKQRTDNIRHIYDTKNIDGQHKTHIWYEKYSD